MNSAPANGPLAEENRLLEEQKILSTRISDTIRNIAFGLLATFYGIVSSDSAFSRAIFGAAPWAVTGVALCGIFALACDYLQYLCGTFATKRALKRTGPEAGTYDETWPEYRLRGLFYWAKQVFACLGFLLLTYALATGTMATGHGN
jgi:hypothetical protein